MGSHALELDDEIVQDAPSPLFLAHYPVRSERQIRTKVLCGWLSHETNATRKPGQIFQWERLFERCKNREPIDAQELQSIAMAYAQDDAEAGLVEDPLPTDSPNPSIAQETQEPWTLFMQDATLLAATR